MRQTSEENKDGRTFLERAFEEALPKLARKETQETLGDRSTYIGASDAGDCPFRVAHSHEEQVAPPSVKKLVHFMRGHLSEYAVGRVFEAAKVTFVTHAEFPHPEHPHLIVHPDLLIHDGEELARAGLIHVVQVKSPDAIPVTVPDQYVIQIHAEMTMVHLHHARAQVTGSFFFFNLRTPPREVAGYAYDPELGRLAVGQMALLWRMRQGEVEAKPRPNHFCGECALIGRCPAWNGEVRPIPAEIRQAVERIGENQRIAKEAKEKAEADKELVRRFFGEPEEPDLRALKRCTFRSLVSGHPVKHTFTRESREFDAGRLSEHYPEVYADERLWKAKKGGWRFEVRGRIGEDEDGED